MSYNNQTESTCEPESWARSLGHLGLAGGSFPREISNLNREAGPGNEHKYRTAPPNALAQECPGQRLHGSSQTQANGITGASPRDQRKTSDKLQKEKQKMWCVYTAKTKWFLSKSDMLSRHANYTPFKLFTQMDRRKAFWQGQREQQSGRQALRKCSAGTQGARFCWLYKLQVLEHFPAKGLGGLLWGQQAHDLYRPRTQKLRGSVTQSRSPEKLRSWVAKDAWFSV